MTAHVEYKGKQLPRLTVGQIVCLADEVYDDRRRAVLTAANVANLGDEGKRSLILHLERERGLAADVIRWAYTARGTMRIVEESLKRHGNGLAIDDLGLDIARDYTLALRLLGFEPAESEAGDESADPTTVPPRGGT